MKLRLALCALLIATPAYAQAPAKQITMTVSEPNLILIWKALNKEPYGDVKPLMDEITRQVAPQLNPPAAPVEPAPAPK